MKTKAQIDLDKYLSQFPKDKIADIECPYCRSVHGALKPVEIDYDTLTACPDCQTTFFKTLTVDGLVITKQI